MHRSAPIATIRNMILLTICTVPEEHSTLIQSMRQLTKQKEALLQEMVSLLCMIFQYQILVQVF